MLTLAKIEMRDLRPICGSDGKPLVGMPLRQAWREQVLREHADPELTVYAGFDGEGGEDALWLLAAPAGKTPMEVLAPNLLAGKTAECLPYLEVLVKVAPDLHAWYSLGMAYWMLDRKDESIAPLRRAYALDKTSEQLRFVLGRALASASTTDLRSEGDLLLQSLTRTAATAPFFEEVVSLRNAYAQQQLSTTGFRPDALMYMVDALKKMAGMDEQAISQVFHEVGLLGRQGFDLVGPDKQYHLRNWPGEHTGMYCISLLYVCIKRLNLDLDMGLDLSAEYSSAVDMLKITPAR